MRHSINIKFLLTYITCLYLQGCATQEKIVTHEVAVPVERLVYRQLDTSLFQGCPDNPSELIGRITVGELLQNRDNWKLVALCVETQLQTIQTLK